MSGLSGCVRGRLKGYIKSTPREVNQEEFRLNQEGVLDFGAWSSGKKIIKRRSQDVSLST